MAAVLRATRIAAKICAYTYAFLVNRMLGRPKGAPRSYGHGSGSTASLLTQLDEQEKP